MPLTDLAIRNAKPQDKPYKLADSRGLFLLIAPSGGKLWRLKFRVGGREKKLALGAYPDVSLSEARAKRDEARKSLAAGNDPAQDKQVAKLRRRDNASNTFAVVARAYFDKRQADGDRAWAIPTLQKNEWLLSLLVPPLGNRPVTEIKPVEILDAVSALARKGNRETA